MSTTLNSQEIVQPNRAATEFWLRRLHSLLGLLPLTFFLFFHFGANSLALENPARFDQVIFFLRGIPHLILVETVLLALPFLFHGLYGLVITPQFVRSKPNVYSHQRNWAYFLQRVSGIITFVFLAVHVYQFRFAENLSFAYVSYYLHQPAWAVFYFLGITCSVYHLANGLWNFFISWGITIGKKAQKVSAIFCALLGLGLWGLGLLILWAFANPPAEIAANF